MVKRNYYWIIPLLISLILGGASGYAVTAQRIAVVETHQTDTTEELKHVNQKLDWMMEHWYDRAR